MTKTQIVLLRSCAEDFWCIVATSGQIGCSLDPAIPIVLMQPPKIQAQTGRAPLRKDSIGKMERMLALSCTYDDNKTDGDAVRHQLMVLEIAFQLVKPTVSFMELWIRLDDDNLTEIVSRPVSDLGRELGPAPYLQYQQHNCLTQPDVERAVRFLPRLADAFDRQHSSWKHPFLPIHRALVFFCQGYTITPRDPRQFLWAAGLDCLYASKLDRKKQGSPEICRRMQQFLGAKLKLYEADTVSIPYHQTTRRNQELETVTADIFKLRNAFAHGLQIPDVNWFSDTGQPVESEYAYQLMEQTEIALRLTLVKILEDRNLFDTFSDPNLLDAYFP